MQLNVTDRNKGHVGGQVAPTDIKDGNSVHQVGVDLPDLLFSVMIVNWNGREFLGRCIDSVISQSIPRSLYEVIVVDNASSDGSIEYVKKNYPDVILIENKTDRGFAGGNNNAFNVGRGRFFALLNNDALADYQWLESIKAEFENHPNTGIVSSKIFLWNRENAPFNESNALLASWPKINLWDASGVDFEVERPRHKVDYANGAAMALRKSVYGRIGGFDEAYFMYYEDTDLSARAIRAGFDVMYVPAAKVWHRHSASMLKSGPTFTYRMVERNRIRFVLKNFDTRYVISFMTLYVMKIVVKVALLAVWDLFVFFKKFSKNVTSAHSYGIEFQWALQVRTMPYAVWWNLSNLVETLAIRKQNNRQAVSGRYCENLPLRNVRLPPQFLMSKLLAKLGFSLRYSTMRQTRPRSSV
jgi:hypothetical protein